MSSAASKKADRLERKLQVQLRACQKEPGNKRCADCTERLPQWIISDFNTFVCTACSGIHREFSHRVKSISLATFSEEEVAAVKAGGNEASNKLYMARYRPGHDLPEPEGGRAAKHREFIRTKYVDKRWYGTPEDLANDRQREAEREESRAKRDAERGSSSSGNSSSKKQQPRAASAARPRKASGDRGLRKVEPAAAAVKAPPVPAKPVDLLDFLSDDPAPPPAAPAQPAAAAAAPAQAQPWDAFGAPAPTPPAAAAPAAAGTAAGFASWAAFGDDPAVPQTAPPPPLPQQQQQQQPVGFGASFPAAPQSG
ncbi:unnamed protein product, partial [Ectocarpus sp. 6 AP-2014]